MQSRVVIVTGGAAGIGRATARRFAAAGARVAVWDLREGEEGAGVFQRVDVTDPAAVEAATAEVFERWGRIDVLVNNAGIVKDAQLVKWKDGRQTGEMSERDFDAVLSVNLKGVFLCTRTVVPRMIAAGGGVILNASSVVGLYGNFGQTNYAATKAGVISMTRTWARELGATTSGSTPSRPASSPPRWRWRSRRRCCRGWSTIRRSAAWGPPRTSPRPTSGSPRMPRASSPVPCSRWTAAW
jgi:3-oxoacyl-[acyl-carrier protein] reductase